MKPLTLGVAYHGNRLLSHVQSDMKDIALNRFNTVVHMFSHNDWDRHANIMKEIFDITFAQGLDVWVDNWGLGGPPGDKSHFLAYHPEAHQYFSDGEMLPTRVCLNSEAFISWTKEWVDKVYECGGRKIFWDEPHLKATSERFACACPTCKKLFEERYGKKMPIIPDKDCYDFQEWSIVNYFRQVTEYSAKKGMYNSVCVMLSSGIGINIDNMDAFGNLDTLHNIGTDPYWVSRNLTGTDVYKYVYENTKKTIAAADGCGKEHNVWIQGYNTPAGTEEDIVYATEAAYDAGSRQILVWGYRGSEGNDYRAKQPDIAWRAACDGIERILNKERTKIVEAAKKRIE